MCECVRVCVCECVWVGGCGCGRAMQGQVRLSPHFRHQKYIDGEERRKSSCESSLLSFFFGRQRRLNLVPSELRGASDVVNVRGHKNLNEEQPQKLSITLYAGDTYE